MPTSLTVVKGRSGRRCSPRTVSTRAASLPAWVSIVGNLDGLQACQGLVGLRDRLGEGRGKGVARLAAFFAQGLRQF